MRLSTMALAVCLAAAAPAGGAGAQPFAESVMVEVDRAKVVRLADPASTVILGNPAIADALVQDSRILVVTGKSYGTTNLIVLDADGEQAGEYMLHVRAADDGVVTMQRGQSRMTLSCAPTCAPTLSLGDTTDTFEILSGQIENRLGLSQGQAGR